MTAFQFDGADSRKCLPSRKWLVCCLGLVLSAVSLPPVWACKYTVRDVAFVDMDHSWYRIYLYLAEETSADEAARLRSSAELALADSIVNLEVITVGKNHTDASLTYWKSLDIESTPSAVLVSPDGRARRLRMPPPSPSVAPDETPQRPPGESRPEAIRQTIDSVLHSPLRSEILAELMTAHSVVLIIEGEDQAQNLLAKTIVESAIKRIEATLPDLPKPIDIPPQMIILPAKAARDEALLLWSLGVDVDSQAATQIALLFGRGRKLGSVMDVREIAEQDVLRTLAVVGLDCECDLDRSWMQAPMFPHVWTATDESQAVKSLGFDPGHPLVKVEISRILSRGPSSAGGDASGGNGQGRSSLATDALLPGLQIIELNFDDDDDDDDNQGHQNDPFPPKIEAAGGAADGGSVLGGTTSSRAEGEALSAAAVSDTLASDAGKTDSELVGPAQREPPTSPTVAHAAADTSTSSTTRVVSATLLGLALIGLLGGAFVVFYGRRNGP